MSSIINATTTAGVTVQGDNSGSLQLATNNGTTAVTITTAQNVGIGTTTPTGILHTVKSGADSTVNFEASTAGYASNLQLIANNSAGGAYNNITSFAGASALWRIGGGGVADTITFSTGSSVTERMRITSAGNVLIGQTAASNPGDGNTTTGAAIEGGGVGTIYGSRADSYSGSFNRNSDGTLVKFARSGSGVGSISVTTSSTAYNTSSDYRLKENVAPMTGALAKVAQLKPVTYNWKVDGSAGQGFIAHELQEVVPDAVTGEKDAVETYTDEEGNEQTRIKPQGVDTSFLVATLTSAIQELKAELDATKAEVQALKGTL